MQVLVASQADDPVDMLSYHLGMPVRIGPKRPRKLYLAEWRQHLGLTQEQLGSRIGRDGVDKGTVSRWETGTSRPSEAALQALAEAMGKPREALYTPPSGRPSVVELLSAQPQDIQQEVAAYIEFLIARRKAS